MNKLIEEALRKAGDSTAVTRVKQIQGGSINDSLFVQTKKEKYFIKHHTDAPEDFFKLEEEGLRNIQNTNSIDVPEVLAYSDDKGKGFLIMEWVEGEKTTDTDRMLGERIAKLHQTAGKEHGFKNDTFIGVLPQPNGLFNSWLEYYRDQRLGAQLDQGIRQKSIARKRKEKLEKLLTQLGRWVPQNVVPSYLHGDLWGGNWLVGREGVPYVIDPSFLYGDRHFELAFTELFGGFSSAFYQAYETQFPLDENYEEVKPLYQLYYLLVHLNMFGEAYGPSVDMILDRYVGN
ncbi:fructosamine kinase family protein [Virgibacillus ainsalahensis]